MTTFFLLVLAMAWVAVFLPAIARARESDPLTTAERFRRRMDLIAPRWHAGRWIVVPESYDRLKNESFRRGQRRRRRLLALLSLTVAGSGIVAFIEGGNAWQINLMLDASLAMYVGLLLEAKRKRRQSAAKVRSISAARKQRSPVQRRPAEVLFYEPVQVGRR